MPATKEKRETIQARIQPENKEIIVKAAKLRDIPLSDYIRSVTLEQARKEVASQENLILQLTAEEQLNFWQAIDNEPVLTKKQKELGKLMKGEI